MNALLRILPVLAALCCCSCERRVTVTEEMAWQCDFKGPGPEPPSGVELLTLRYPEDPAYFDVASGRGICAELRAAGRKTATVVYVVWGPPGELQGYRIEKIDGKPFHELDPGVAHSGYQGARAGRIHPLQRALQ
ncbi:MAG: hypothetical protein JST11_17950 [Acidobacteria bacterium]|nr:hypothetical protein [Acidobacteriota bacterium]